MKKLLLTLSLFISCIASAQIRIAVIDTGKPRVARVPVCESGHKDFTNTSINDVHGHASHVSDLIYQYAGDKGYCAVFFKYWTPTQLPKDSLDAIIASLKTAADGDYRLVMVAGGGFQYSLGEYAQIKRILNKGNIVVAAAGNEMQDLDVNPYYPAYYDDRIVVVGGYSEPGVRRFNDGSKVDRYERGWNVKAMVNGVEQVMSGTSQATGIATGKIVKKLLKK